MFAVTNTLVSLLGIMVVNFYNIRLKIFYIFEVIILLKYKLDSLKKTCNVRVGQIFEFV